MRKCAAYLAFLVLVGIVPARSNAAHTVFFRYTVLGYVKEASGKARPGVPVRVTRQKTGLAYEGETDPTGLYVVVTRLGDESLGESLQLRAADHAVTIVARFDPSDHRRERGTRVDFEGSTTVETPGAFAATLDRFLGK